MRQMIHYRTTVIVSLTDSHKVLYFYGLRLFYMSHNNYFKFKQFTIIQDNAAMRVGTDGVLLGAWSNINEATNILDIGTGTGLVALMLAQRNAIASILGIDIDHGAWLDSSLNFELSPWNDRLLSQEISLNEFVGKCDVKFDFIACNPPFFNNSMKSADPRRETARHTSHLPFNELISCVANILAINGIFSVIIPIEEEDKFCKYASTVNLYPKRILHVRHNCCKPFVRSLIEFRFNAIIDSKTELTIETEVRHIYSQDFSLLTKDFYME